MYHYSTLKIYHMKVIKTLTYTEKKSKFIAVLVEIKTPEDSKSALKELQEEHKDARHILRALRYPNQYGVYVTEASEDKEPISSMKKTRELMERKDIRDVGVYIVRYFGGTKLGASHLDRIYFTLATQLICP